MTPQLIVMLTHHDLTVCNAYEVFGQCQFSKAQYWGFKEQPLPTAEMRRIYAKMKDCGKTTVMEVVAYSKEEGLEGARMAAQCGSDILMGTCFDDEILAFCQDHNMRYMPFVGQISGRPSVLEGSIDNMVAEARRYIDKGAYGIDLLGYRYTGNAELLISEMTNRTEAPICVAGSIDSYERLDHIKQTQPWAFTIGSAFFEHRFGSTIAGQIDAVCDYLNN